MKQPPLKRIVERIISEAFEDQQRRNELISIYSDTYKEKNGIRPRWKLAMLEDMTVEEIEQEIDDLMNEPDQDYDGPDYERDLR